MITPITLGGQTVSVVALPHGIGSMAAVDFSYSKTVASVTSIFTGQERTQEWTGGDMWSGTMTLPPLTQAQADDWISFLLECDGMTNAFQIGDPLKRKPRGAVAGVPVVDGSLSMAAGGKTLYSKGWTASKFRLLVPGDYLQIGYRLHRVVNPVNSDASGKAAINIRPSLREVPTDSEAVVLNNPVGLFRLDTNKFTWSADPSALTKLSFPIREYR